MVCYNNWAMNSDLIKRLKDDPYFTEFKEIIIAYIDELNSIDGFEKMTNRDAGELVRARSIASGILQDILEPFINFVEKREPTVKEINAAKAKAGL